MSIDTFKLGPKCLYYVVGWGLAAAFVAVFLAGAVSGEMRR